jgi:anthranilate phosphoribosyltransferase
MPLRDALRSVLGGEELDRERAREVFASALSEESDPILLAGLLTALAQRGESVDEIAGAAEALRERMVPFEHPFSDAIDTCGTGGDGLSTFNVSTTAAVVAAAAGARVVKHGNRSVSSRSGSADVLETLGVPIELEPAAAAHVLEEVGITFLFAPRYHPSMRFAAPVRGALGIRTIFNFLGPLCNPGRVRRQLLGVNDADRMEDFAHVLERLGHEAAYVVHGADGADELTLAAGNRVRAVGTAPPLAVDPSGLGLELAPIEALRAEGPEDSARILVGVLTGEAGPARDITLLNAACALVVAGLDADPLVSVERARAAIDSGAAEQTLENWRRCALAQRGGG